MDVTESRERILYVKINSYADIRQSHGLNSGHTSVKKLDYTMSKDLEDIKMK